MIPIGGCQKNWEYSCGLLHKFLVRKSATFQRNAMKVSKFHPALQAIRFYAVSASLGSVLETGRWSLERVSAHWIQGKSDSSLSYACHPSLLYFLGPFITCLQSSIQAASLLPMLGARLLKNITISHCSSTFPYISSAYGVTHEHCMQPWKQQKGVYQEHCSFCLGRWCWHQTNTHPFQLEMWVA